MDAIRVQQVMRKDGEVVITGLPYKQGQSVEIILFPQPLPPPHPRLTVGQFRKLGLIGLWKDRDDIQDSAVYARQIREQAQRRRHIDYDIPG